jgi:quinolinate synthase
LVNPAKCSMIFGSNCSVQEQERVLQILQVTNTTMDAKYLGLPTPEGRMGKGKFKTTKEKLVNKCTAWAERHMLMGAKEVLIKSVAQAIPTYTMVVFKLPLSTCNEMTQIIRRFW